MTTEPSNLWSSNHRLLASRHTTSCDLRFPPFTPASPLAAQHETVALEPQGTVYSFTVIHPNPKSGAQPFALGYVDLPGPIRLFGRIEGERVHIGAPCEARPDAAHGYVFQLTA